MPPTFHISLKRSNFHVLQCARRILQAHLGKSLSSSDKLSGEAEVITQHRDLLRPAPTSTVESSEST